MILQVKSPSQKGYNIPPVIDLRFREIEVKGLRLIKIEDVFPDQDVVFLGCGRPNIYLTVPDGKGGYQKFAGKTLRRAPCTIENTRGWLQSGFLVRFRNLPANASDRIRNAMLLHHGKRYWTCVNASARIMHSGGFTAGDKPFSSIYFPGQLMRALFNNELLFDGKRVECEVIRTTSLNIEKYTDEIVQAMAAKFFRLGDPKKIRRLKSIPLQENSTKQLEPQAVSPRAREIESWLLSSVSAQSGIRAEEIDPTKPFAYYGLDSMSAVCISGDLEDWLHIDLSANLLFEYPTFRELANHLANELLTKRAADGGQIFQGFSSSHEKEFST